MRSSGNESAKPALPSAESCAEFSGDLSGNEYSLRIRSQRAGIVTAGACEYFWSQHSMKGQMLLECYLCCMSHAASSQKGGGTGYA
jgi:hypothetical protein